MTYYQELYAGKQVCCNCTHYYQHYRKGKKRYSIVAWGHCGYPRIKARRPDQTCGNWTPEPQKEEPVSDG